MTLSIPHLSRALSKLAKAAIQISGLNQSFLRRK
jgi:hypothetical protein